MRIACMLQKLLKQKINIYVFCIGDLYFAYIDTRRAQPCYLYSFAMPGALALTRSQSALLTACCVPLVLFPSSIFDSKVKNKA